MVGSVHLAHASDASASLYSRIGGAPAVERLIDLFYDTMSSEPAARHIRSLHPLDLDLTRWVLKHFVLELIGGPRPFSAKSSRPGLRPRHDRFVIRPEDKDAWLLCMRRAMDEVVTDDAARQELERRFVSIANWMINAPSSENRVND
jgi:hemoglobin